MTSRPAESAQATVAALIGAVVVLWGAFQDGLDFNDFTDLEVQGAILFLTGFVAAARTWWIARKQRAKELRSAADGSVIPATP